MNSKLLYEKYQPTSLKSLFHKDTIVHYRKWIKMIEQYAMDKNYKSCQQILFVSGPISCGKSVSTHVLLKSFNVINIDPIDLRVNEKCNEILTSIVNVHEATLSNMFTKSKTPHLNIVVIDNIELCEKNIRLFVDSIHNTFMIPIILICNNSKLKDLFTANNNCTHLEFKKPSLLELTKLVTDINIQEKLNLSKEAIKQIIEISMFDTRQVFFILQHWSLNSNDDFASFIENTAQKHADLDLVNKLIYIFNNGIPFNNHSTFSLTSSDPIMISNGIFQNYIDLSPNSTSNNVDNLDLISSIADDISYSNLIQHQIFNEQRWDLYDIYTMTSCVFPSYKFKVSNSSNLVMKEQELFNKINMFKEVSYNFITSFNDIKQTCIANMLSKRLNSNNVHSNMYNDTISTTFSLAMLLTHQINLINTFFEKNKKGKNTSKQEKLELYKRIPEGELKDAFNNMVNLIYEYRLFEIDIDETMANYKNDKETYIKNNFNKVDIRILKRFLNIFTINENYDASKVIKSHVEMALKYQLFYTIINNLEQNIQQIQPSSRNIDDLIDNLDNIWGLT